MRAEWKSTLIFFGTGIWSTWSSSLLLAGDKPKTRKKLRWKKADWILLSGGGGRSAGVGGSWPWDGAATVATCCTPLNYYLYTMLLGGIWVLLIFSQWWCTIILGQRSNWSSLWRGRSGPFLWSLQDLIIKISQTNHLFLMWQPGHSDHLRGLWSEAQWPSWGNLPTRALPHQPWLWF